jgi:hypothetical protein
VRDFVYSVTNVQIILELFQFDVVCYLAGCVDRNSCCQEVCGAEDDEFRCMAYGEAFAVGAISV